MDKLTPSIQDTPVTPKAVDNVSQWYETETTSGAFTPSQIGWLHAQGYQTTSYAKVGANPALWALARRTVKAESILQDLVTSYTEAYNTGRNLNDQRYDDLVVLYTQVLDKTEDSYNLLQADDDAYEALAEITFAAYGTDFSAYDTDVTGDLDDWGTDLLAEINARFNALLASGKQALVDRGMHSSAQWPTTSAGIERERTRALNNANDTIAQRQLELKHKVYSELVAMRTRTLAARDRLRVFLHGSKDKQVAIRNRTVEALARLVEARTDSYPDMAAIGRLAAGLGAGSPASYAP